MGNITWFDAKEREGKASLYGNCITLNVAAMVPFEMAYRVMVGFDENKNIVIEPISKERAIRGDIDEYRLLNYVPKRSFGRIANVPLMKKIEEVLDIHLGKEGMKFDTE